MADGALQRICACASLEIEHALLEMFPTARPVTAALLKYFSQSGYYTDGWQVILPESDTPVYILKPYSYPERLIDIFVRDRWRFAPRPHLLMQGLLCLAPTDAQHNPGAHVAASLTRVTRADMLLAQKPEDIAIEDWTAEIRSYWPMVRDEIVSLVTPNGPSRRIVTTFTGDQCYIADDEVFLRTWLHRRTGVKYVGVTQPAVLLWLAAPMHGPPFPATYAALLQSLPAAGSLIDPPLQEVEGQLPVVIAWGDGEQPVLLGLMLMKGWEAWQDLVRGTPFEAKLRQRNFAVPPRIVRCSVQRADPDWIAFRGGRVHMHDLRSRHVALLGCGSLGGGLAELLAHSGVGALTVVDPDIVTYDNIGRLNLGAESVGQPKAEALKAKIERALPHISCTAVTKSWTAIERKLGTFDLTISTMAIWQENMLLNRIAIETSVRPLIYGWLEPHALAAHAVCIRTARSCIECGFSVDGRAKTAATIWDGDTRQPEPGCGGMFQPYGAIDLVPAHALVAELALDVLCGKIRTGTWRIWLGSSERLNALGGRWNPAWEDRVGAVGNGRMAVESSWSSDDGCPACGRI